MLKSIKTVIGMLLISILVFVIVPLFLLPKQCRRSEGIQHGDKLLWMAGTVSVWDYCLHPGSYDNQIEWRSANGERKVLLEVGDTTPQLSISKNGELIAVFLQDDRKKWVRVKWKSLDLIVLHEERNDYPGRE